MSLFRFLGLKDTSATAPLTETDTVRKIATALDQMDPQQSQYIAMFAYILGRVAHADSDITEEETRQMEASVMELADLPEEQAILVVQIAKTQNRLFGGTENYLVTRAFNKIATRDQKLSLLRCLFVVSATDQDISSREDQEVKQIASELKLERRDFIAVRSSYRKYLSVLKGKEPES